MKKFLGIFIFLAAIYLLLATNSYAQYYGGETPSYAIIVDKMVAKPGTSEYVDNLSPSDPRFAPGQDVWFRIRVKNTSDRVLYDVKLRDYVASYLEPVEGPGSWDSNTRIISWNGGDFAVDEEKTYFFKMRVYGQANLPSDKGLFCIVNRADGRNDNVYDDDSSQLCIEKKVSGVSTVPSAGPELGVLLFSGELLALTSGLFINRKLRK